MTTLSLLAAGTSDTVTRQLADVTQQIARLDALLDELRSAGIQLQIKEGTVGVYCWGGKKMAGLITLQITHHPGQHHLLHDICIKHGTDWYQSPQAGTPLLLVGDVTLRIILPPDWPEEITP